MNQTISHSIEQALGPTWYKSLRETWIHTKVHGSLLYIQSHYERTYITQTMGAGVYSWS
jgi:hypothetical protein